MPASILPHLKMTQKHRPHLHPRLHPHLHINSKLHIIPSSQELHRPSHRIRKHPPDHTRLRLHRQPQCPCSSVQILRIYNLLAYFPVGVVGNDDICQSRLDEFSDRRGRESGAVVVEFEGGGAFGCVVGCCWGWDAEGG